MASDLNTEIKIGADASGVEAGVSRAKRSLKDLGDSAKKAGQDAGAGMASVGAGGDKAAQDVERATKNIQGQLERAIASFDAGEKGSRKFYESLARQRGADVNTLKPLLDQLDAYKSKSEAAAQASAKVGTSFTGLSTAAGLAARAMAAIGITASVGEFVRMADASTNVASRLGLVTSSAAELANVQQRLFGIAQSSRVSFTDLVGTYAQVARSTKDLGVSQTALLGVIQTISQAVTISGGSAASAQAALTQLSQGFAAGALRGEELNSIMEQTPRLAQAIADGMGVSVGKLRELGQAGALTAEAVLGALEKSAAGVAAEFGKMAVTVEQASTNAANSVLRLVGAFDRLLGVTSAVGGAIQTISNGLDFLSSDVEKLGNQGPLRDAAREVINLNAAAERLRTGMASGVLGPNAQGELDRINARLAEAKKRFRELDQQLSGVRDPRDQSGFTGRGASYANEAARQAKLREDANAFRLNQAGVPASYLKDMAELIRLNQAGVIVGKEYTDALKAQQDLLLKKTTTVRGSAAAANAEQNAYESLIASIRAKIEADNLEIAGGAALTESQRIRIKLDQDLAAGRVKLTAQNERAVRLALEELAVSEASALAAKTLAKANLDAAASREKYLTSLSTGLDKIKADTAAQLEATARLGLSKEAIAELDAAKLEMLATDLELQAIKAMDRNLDEQTYNALKQQAEAYRELAAAKKAGAAKEMELDLVKANQEAAKKAADEWQRAADDINRSLTDALMRGFESGKGFAENLRSTLKNMFSTLVLRPIISAVMSPVAGAVNGVVNGVAGSIGSSMLSSAGTSLIGRGAMGGMLGGFGSGFMSGMSETLLGSSFVGPSASYAGGATGFGAQLGSIAPWALGAIALLSIIKSLDDSGTYHTGGAARYSKDRGLSSGQDATEYNIGFGRVEKGDETIDTVGRLAKGLAQSLDGVATSFGRTAGFEIATAFADDTSKDGAWGAFRISLDGKELLNWENDRQSKWAPREFADGKEGYQQYLDAIAKDTRQVLMDMDLASWADKLLTGLGETPTMEALTNVIAQINQIQSAFEGLGRSMEMFSGLTDEMQSGLLDAAGSIEALTAGAGAFYQGFYSEQERIDSAVAQLNETLAGLDLSIDPRLGDDAKEQFRAAVEAAFAAGDAELAAALLALSGTFANTADYFQQIAARQADTMGRLQIDLLRAQGNNLAAVVLERERELAALAQFGPAAVAMQQQIYGLIDAMAASNAAANAYFADIDRAAAEQGYTDDAQAALDAMFGSISGGADAAAQSAASAAADAAKAAAASWRTAASSIQSSLEKLRASTTALSDPASRYAETKSVLDEYTRLALGGDASAADKLAGAADAFLSASEGGTITQAEYLRDRVLTEAKLASVMESSEAQASLQESIASSAGAAVSELQALNSNLTGFAGDLYDLLRNSYSDVGRDGATGIAATFAKMQADFDAYFNASTGWAAVGSKYSDPSFGGASFTKLDNNMAQFTGADGSIGYIRAGESLLDVAKRIPELRKLWEQTYNIRLPAFAVGTNYVPKDMTARIHEGEAIVPKAFNPWANGGGSTGRDSEALIAELRTVTAQLVKVEARLAEIEKTNDQMAQQQDNGTDGGNAYRAEIMNVAALAQAIKEATV